MPEGKTTVVDAVAGQLEAERLGQAPQGELARLVGAEATGRVEDRRRRREGEPPVRRAPEEREERPDDPSGADDVHVEHEAPLVVGEPLDRAEQLDADVGHDEVGATETLLDAGRSVIDAGGVGDVDRLGRRRHPAGAGDPCRLVGGPGAVTVEQGDVHPEGGTPLAQGQAEPGGGAGDDGDRAHEPAGGVWKSVCSRVSLDEAIRQPSAPFT
jgi:hypothetical protein